MLSPHNFLKVKLQTPIGRLSELVFNIVKGWSSLNFSGPLFLCYSQKSLVYLCKSEELQNALPSSKEGLCHMGPRSLWVRSGFR